MPAPHPSSELAAAHDEHRAAQARLRGLNRIGRVLTGVLALVLVGSLVSLYRDVTSMYAAEQFERPLREEALNLLPRLEPELRLLWSETAPVYGDLAWSKLEAALPEVQERAYRELAVLRASVASDAEDRIHAALERISRNNEARLAAVFPELSEPDGANEVGQRWMDAMATDLEQVMLHFHDRYSDDLGDLAATLDQFRTDELEQMSEEELSRQFVHLWLMKADQWVMPGDTAAEECAHVE